MRFLFFLLFLSSFLFSYTNKVSVCSNCNKFKPYMSYNGVTLYEIDRINFNGKQRRITYFGKNGRIYFDYKNTAPYVYNLGNKMSEYYNSIRKSMKFRKLVFFKTY